MRVLVCGGREFADFPLRSNGAVDRSHPRFSQAQKERNFIICTLDKFCIDRGLVTASDSYGNWLPDNIIIIQGGARGADRAADEWAIINWVPLETYLPDWDKYRKAAGPIRNKQMLDEGKPDVVIAFPGGRGTANMVSLAKKAGVEVVEVPYT